MMQSAVSRRQGDAWGTGRIGTPLTDGEVHVWCADLSRVDREDLRSLAPEERARSRSFLSPTRGGLWARGRAVLRDLLAAYLDTDPASLTLLRSSRGKPRLADGGLSFNMSHSGELALYALARDMRLGVDIELWPAGEIDWLGLAARVFGADEATRLSAFDPACWPERCLRRWVCLEAKVKCLGDGISLEPQAHLSLIEASAPWTIELQAGRRGCAALAVDPQPSSVRCWEWSSGPKHAVVRESCERR